MVLFLAGVMSHANEQCSQELNESSDLQMFFENKKPELLSGLLYQLNKLESFIDIKNGDDVQGYCLVLNLQEITDEIFSIAASDTATYEFVILKLNERYEYFMAENMKYFFKDKVSNNSRSKILMHKYESYFDLMNLSYQRWASLYLDKVVNSKEYKAIGPILAITGLRMLNASNISRGGFFQKFTKKGSKKLLRLRRYFFKRQVLARATVKTPRVLLVNNVRQAPKLIVAKGYDEKINDDVVIIDDSDYPKSPLEILAESIKYNKQWVEEPIHKTYNFYKEYMEQQIITEASAISAGIAAGTVAAKASAGLMGMIAKLAEGAGKTVPHLFVKIVSSAIGFYAVFEASRQTTNFFERYFDKITIQELNKEFEARKKDILKYNKNGQITKMHNSIQAFLSYVIQYGNYRILPLISDRYVAYNKVSNKINLDFNCSIKNKSAYLSNNKTMPSQKLLSLIESRTEKIDFSELVEDNRPEVSEALKRLDEVTEFIKGLDTPLKETYMTGFKNYKSELEIQLNGDFNKEIVKHDLEVIFVKKLLQKKKKSEFKLPYIDQQRSMDQSCKGYRPLADYE